MKIIIDCLWDHLYRMKLLNEYMRVENSRRNFGVSMKENSEYSTI